MYTECLYTKCIPHFDKLLYTFFIQNLADIVLWILYTKCSYTKACRNVVASYLYILYTFCIHFVDIICIHLKQFLYTKCIHSFRVG